MLPASCVAARAAYILNNPEAERIRDDAKRETLSDADAPTQPSTPPSLPNDTPVSPAQHPALMGSLDPPIVDPADFANFSPGPTSLPAPVEAEIARRFASSRLTSMAMSHRSPEFAHILREAGLSLRRVMAIPTNYEVLFMHGGGHGQFAAVPLNLCSDRSQTATYVVSGTWSQRACAEAQKYCNVKMVNKTAPDYTSFPELTEDDIAEGSKFIWVCSNETVNGVELHRLPRLPGVHRGRVPLVVDASSDFTSKPVDWVGDDIGVLFACASKNIGHPGVTVVVVRSDLLGSASPLCPGVFDYAGNAAAGSMWNTTATFNVEVVGTVMRWIEREGGVEEMERRSLEKSSLIYDTIAASGGFYTTPAALSSRSRMNVPFEVAGGNMELTEAFLIESWEQGMVGLRTVTPFGTPRCLRASLYHGVSVRQAARLAEFMRVFAERHGGR